MQNSCSILILLSISGWIKTFITASERPARLWAPQPHIEGVPGLVRS